MIERINPEGITHWLSQSFRALKRWQMITLALVVLGSGEQSRTGPGPAGSVPGDGPGSLQPLAGQRQLSGVTGTAEKVEGSTLTISTSDGETEAIVDNATTINKISQVGIEEIQIGERVMVMAPIDN